MAATQAHGSPCPHPRRGGCRPRTAKGRRPPVDENAERKRPRSQFRVALPCITAQEGVRGDAREVWPDAEQFPTGGGIPTVNVDDPGR